MRPASAKKARRGGAGQGGVLRVGAAELVEQTARVDRLAPLVARGLFGVQGARRGAGQGQGLTAPAIKPS